MTARFLLRLREWDHRMSNPGTETDQWDIHGDGQPTTHEDGQLEPTTHEDGQPSTHGDGQPTTHTHAIQLNKPEPRTTTTQWTIKDVLGDDPMLKPVAFEVSPGPEGGPSSGASTSRTGVTGP